MLVRSDPFRDLDRFTQQLSGTAARPAAMPMDAWRDGEQFVVEFDLPGIDEQSLDLDIERNVVTVRAERPDVDPSRRCWQPNGRVGCSVGNWCSATISTPNISTRVTTPGYCGCVSLWPRRPSHARSRSTAGIGSRPQSAPDGPVPC